LLLTVICLSDLFASGVYDDENTHYLGVYLTEEEYAGVSSDQFQLLEQMGISVIEFEGLAPQSIINLIDEYRFRVFTTQPRRFVTSPELQRNDSLYFQEDLFLIQEYRARIGEAVAAFGLFIYPDDTSINSRNLLDQYATSFQGVENGELLIYYRSAFSDLQNYPESFSFRSTHIETGNNDHLPTQVIHFIPPDDHIGSLRELKSVLELSLNRDQSIVMLPYSWLLKKLNEFELLGDALIAFTGNQALLFAEPDVRDSPLSPNWAVIIFIILLGTYIAHYHSSALYQRSLLRYFTMHKFFLDDVMEYRIRTSISATVLFSQHILITGLFVYILADTFLSPLGTDALYHHFPVINIFGSGSLGIALFGFFLAASLQFISVAWLHLINNQSRLSQAMTLYCWPLQINFPILLLILAVYQAGGAESWTVLFSLLFVTVCVMSFIIASLDIAVYLTKYRILYIIFTIGLFVAILILIITLLFLYHPVSEPIKFIFLLP
jgi:hypothetical protein